MRYSMETNNIKVLTDSLEDIAKCIKSHTGTNLSAMYDLELAIASVCRECESRFTSKCPIPNQKESTNGLQDKD